MTEISSSVHTFRRNLLVIEWNQRSVLYVNIWLFFIGTITLILRTLSEPDTTIFYYIAMGGFFILTAISYIISRRSIPSPEKLHAYLDKYNKCGGLLLSRNEIKLGEWDNTIPELSQPQLKWNYKQPVIILLSSIIFCIFAFQFPISRIITSSNNTLHIDDEVQALEDQIDVLKDEEIIAESDAEKLQDELKKLQESAMAIDPIKTWESLDHMTRKMRQKAAEATESALKELEQVANIESMAELLSSDQAQSLDSSTMTDAMRELSKMTKESMEQSKQLENFISDELIKAIKAGNLSPKDLKQLQQSLSQSQKAVQETIMKMMQNKMIDPSSMKISKEVSKKSMKKLSEYLKQNCKNGKICEGLVKCMIPGQGGIDRGRGDANMSYTDPSDLTGTKFKPIVLPPAQTADLRSSNQFGTSYTTPDTEGAAVSKSGALSNVKAGGGAGHTHTLLPKHKNIIKEYFNRKQSNE